MFEDFVNEVTDAMQQLLLVQQATASLQEGSVGGVNFTAAQKNSLHAEIANRFASSEACITKAKAMKLR